jgi:hypothetical protein
MTAKDRKILRKGKKIRIITIKRGEEKKNYFFVSLFDFVSHDFFSSSISSFLDFSITSFNFLIISNLSFPFTLSKQT